MKVFACVVILALTLAYEASGKTVGVRGYYRKNGTYVRPHVRHTGGGSSYSTKGNARPVGGASHSSGINASSYGGRGRVPVFSSASECGDLTDQGEQCFCQETCRAVYDNGRRCTRWVDDGEGYCSQHKGYSSDKRPRHVEKALSRDDMEKALETEEKLEKIRTAVDYYSDRRGGELPRDIKILSILNPSFLAPPKKDAWGRAFSFGLCREGLDVRSAGADAEFGTEDDLVLHMEK